MANRFWKGTRWIEIIIPVVILIILAILTLPHFDKFQCRSKQSEARMELMNLFNAQKFYHAQNDTYASLQTLRELRYFSPKEKYYDFLLAYANKTAFMVHAVGKHHTQVAQDRWFLNEHGFLKQMHNKCQ